MPMKSSIRQLELVLKYDISYLAKADMLSLLHGFFVAK